MIKVVDGQVTMQGTMVDILSDISIIVNELLDTVEPKDRDGLLRNIKNAVNIGSMTSEELETEIINELNKLDASQLIDFILSLEEE